MNPNTPQCTPQTARTPTDHPQVQLDLRQSDGYICSCFRLSLISFICATRLIVSDLDCTVTRVGHNGHTHDARFARFRSVSCHLGSNVDYLRNDYETTTPQSAEEYSWSKVGLRFSYLALGS